MRDVFPTPLLPNSINFMGIMLGSCSDDYRKEPCFKIQAVSKYKTLRGYQQLYEYTNELVREGFSCLYAFYVG